MKSIFGFIAGAALGAGGLYGLSKVLKILEPAEVAAPSAPGIPASRPVSTAAQTAAPKEAVEKVAEASVMAPESATAKMVEDPEKAQEAVSKLEELVSLVGEPTARHEEPIAAIESNPEATTPRSETAEAAVPENVEVVNPASTAAPAVKKAPKAAASTAEKKAVKAPVKTTKAAPAKPDDFTVILDIGPAFNKKLLDAGIKTFKELAGMTAAQLEEKTGVPAERIEHGKWIEQAQKLATSEPQA